MTTQPALSIGGTLGVTVSTVSTAILTTNPLMKKLTFHNPGTVTIYVCQSLDINGGALVAGAGQPGNFEIFPGGLLIFEGDGAAGSWLAAAASGTSNPFTIGMSETL